MSGELAYLNPPDEGRGKGDKTRDAIVAFILEHVEAEGFPPTVREIGAAVGLASTATVHHHLHGLVAEGRLVMHPTKPRAIRVVQ